MSPLLRKCRIYLTTHHQLNILSNHVNVVPSSPPSPPITPHDAQKPQVDQADPWAKWNVPEQHVPEPVSRRPGNPRWPRGPQPYKKTVWPKARDMKPLSTDSDGDGGVTCHSDSNGDPDYDIKKLLDYNGDWMPPSEHWEARKGFNNRHPNNIIEQWINGHSDDCTKPIPGGIRRNPESEDRVCKELVPRYWAEGRVEDMTLREFWRDMPRRAPKAVTDIDITLDAPWWDRYEDDTSCCINGLVVPEARIDTSDVENYVPGAGLSIALASAEEKVMSKRKKEMEKHHRRLARQNRPLPQPQLVLPPVDDKRLRPTANVYLRPVQAADVQGITVS